MSRLLMIESWVNANGVILPNKIRALGHSYVLLTRCPDHYAHHSPVAGTHPVLRLAEEVVRVETNNLKQVLECATRLHDQRPFSGVITSCDYYLRAAALVARELGLPGPAPASMNVAVRKDLVREACRRADLAGPAFRVATEAHGVLDFAREQGYPVVVKPVDLCASENVSLVTNDSEAVAAFEQVVKDERNSRGQPRVRCALVESLVDGEELCIETLTQEGRTTVLGISGKTLSPPPSFLELGSHVPASIDEPETQAVSRYVRSVLAAIGHSHGVAHVEVRLTANGPVLIEVNPRMGGDFVSELYQHTLDIDISALEVRLTVGEQVPLLSKVPSSRGSAALRCLLPPGAGQILRVEGVEKLAKDPRYPRVSVKPVEGTEVQEPRDNSSFIGFLIAVDREGGNARRLAEEGIEQLRVVMRT